MSRTKKIAVLAIIAMVLTLMPAAMFGATADSTRLSGANRIETALDIASASTWGTTVVLAASDNANLVDALAAAPLAAQENAPILITSKASLNAAVKAKIAALGATKVYIVGAISDAVAAEVDAMTGVDIVVLKGAGRQATADKVNALLTSPAGTFVVGFNAVPDALSIASYAAKNKYAIMLANADGTFSGTAVGATKYIVGGTAKVADITGYTRIAGADRYATNSAVANTLTYAYDRVYVANGTTGVDALSVAPLAAKYNAFVALTNGSSVAAASVVNAKLASTSLVVAVGGTSAVTTAVAAQLTYAGLAVQSVSAINATQVSVVFNKAVDKATLFADGKSGAFAATATITFTTLDAKLSGALTGVLSADGKTLTVTAANALSKRYDVVVDGIKATTGEAVVKYAQMITIAADTTAPSIVSTTATSASTYKVVFSEPIQTLGTVTYTLADGTAAVVTTDFGAGAKAEVVFTLDAGIVAGKVVTATFIGAQDMAGNILTPNPATATFTKGALDGVKPTVASITQTGAKTLAVKFSEQLVAAPAVAIAGNATVTTEVDATDATKYIVTFTNALDGLTTVSVSAFTDLSGEAGLAVSSVVVLTKDVAAPSVVSTAVVVDSVDKKEYLEITFDKDLDLGVAPTVTGTGSYVLNYVTTTGVNTGAVAVAYKNSAVSKKVIRVALASLVGANKAAVYTLALDFSADVKTAAGIEANSTTATTFTRGEDGVASNANVVTVTAVAAGADNNKVTVKFDKAVDGASATTAANYSVAGAVVSSVTLLPVAGDLTQTVVLNLAANSNLFTGLRNVTVANVKANGSSVPMTTYYGTVDIKENVVPTIVSAKLTAANKVTVTFSEQVDQTVVAIDATDFQLYIGGVAVATNDAVSLLVADSKNDTTTLVFTLEADVTAANLTSGLVLKALPTMNIVDNATNLLSVPVAGVSVTL
ncbi:cell wall-binding repeat-containing protein [Dehalobacter sp. DCM]|uniref:cell wall-binding repeat-containing protein n=1 Tax=Dehalobacter sp. DCM TaxID=2907827 RepID=UPI003081C335|nr:cell wall-binding repeat-containing protein [Dehalobacter sp. DCM]